MLEKLLVYNQYWAGLLKLSDETYFERLSKKQSPEYLWIGCADSRVPAETLMGLEPGQLFVHRNVANQIRVNDSNSMSVLQFAVQVLKVKHIIVCGHSGCGGIKAAYNNEADGYLADWLADIRDLAGQSTESLAVYPTDEEKMAALTELNVKRQVQQIAEHPIVQDAWAQGQELDIHGWVFVIHEGLIKDLQVSRSAAAA